MIKCNIQDKFLEHLINRLNLDFHIPGNSGQLIFDGLFIPPSNIRR